MMSRIVFILFFLMGAIFFAYKKEFEATVLWIGLFVVQLVLFAIDSVKQHIDKTFKSE